jgi:enoyl-CoA hydratase/carnithine racemase
MQPEAVGYRRTRNVGLLLIDNPPVNVLGAAVRKGLAHALELALADQAADVIMIACTGRTFSAGADITEFNAPKTEPTLQSVFAAIEAATKPVVVAMHGTALGGGLELALAGHYRVAVADAKLGLPEITLGVIPGAGGTQRLPRVIGAIAALDMIIAGTQVDATAAQRLGLVDAVVDGELLEGAQQYCGRLIEQGGGPRPTRERPVNADGFDATGIAAVLGKHSRALKGRTTQQLVVEAVTAATHSDFDAGFALERRIADYSLTTTESKALRHLFFAERQVARAAKLSVGKLKEAIAGAGDAGAAALGLLGNKTMLDGYWREVELLRREGVSSEQIDSAMESFGFSAQPPRVNFRLVTHDEERTIERRRVEPSEIIERCILQMINVGAQALEASIDVRAADIDVVWVHGYGFPRHVGGPMFHADTLGLKYVRNRIEHYRSRLGADHWQPAALLERLARLEQSFAQWDSERTAP